MQYHVARRMRPGTGHELGLPVVPLRIKRGKEFAEVSPDQEVKKGDVVSVFAGFDIHQQLLDRLGAEVLDPVLLDYEVDSREIVVLSESAEGRPLSEQGLSLGKEGRERAWDRHANGCFRAGHTACRQGRTGAGPYQDGTSVLGVCAVGTAI
jgi:hypothetical protein